MTNAMKNFNLFILLGPVPERQISTNPGLSFVPVSLLYLRVKAQQHL